MELIIWLMGCFTGSVVTILVFRARTVGILKSKQIDDDGPYLYMELVDEDSMSKIQKSKYIMLEVQIQNSQN